MPSLSFRCKSKMGERLLKRWLRQPLVDPAKIEARLDIVEMLKEDASTRSNLQDQALRSTPDLETLAVRLQRKRAGKSVHSGRVWAPGCSFQACRRRSPGRVVTTVIR